MRPDTQPLAALLASHPEECAAVLAVLCVTADDPASVQNIMFYLRHQTDVKPVYDVIAPIMSAMGEAGLVTVSEGNYFVLVAADRYAIARQGAAAWLRARVGAPATAAQRERAMLVRLHELTAVEARDGRHFEWRIHTDRLTRDDYRALIADVCRQQELDIEAEVAAVWGTAPAPKERG